MNELRTLEAEGRQAIGRLVSLAQETKCDCGKPDCCINARRDAALEQLEKLGSLWAKPLRAMRGDQ